MIAHGRGCRASEFPVDGKIIWVWEPACRTPAIETWNEIWDRANQPLAVDPVGGEDKHTRGGYASETERGQP